MIESMQTGMLLSVAEYLSSGFSPDCEYLDGTIVERNVGDIDQGRSLTRLAGYLFAREAQWETRVLVDLRVRVEPTRYRVPDLRTSDPDINVPLDALFD